MVFSSIPAYLDPSNWQQQSNHQIGSSGGTNPHLPPPQPPLPQPPQPHGGGGLGSIRPGSMADRARMANIPFPEAALKCPRCESTNTKFCYFNNYSLTQPRHFCKTCRRYWTRGGALRNVPVGGGCRRNKRSKGGSSSSKSPASSGDNRQTAPNSASSLSNNSGTASLLGLSPQIPTMPFMAPLHQFSEYGDMGLSYSGISAPMVGGGGGDGYLSAGGMVEQWRLQQQQLPLLGGLDVPSGLLYPFQGGVESSGYGGEGSQIRPKMPGSGLSQMGSVKMEDNQEMGLSRQFLGIPGNDQYWNSTTNTAWTDLSGFSTSSSSNPL